MIVEVGNPVFSKKAKRIGCQKSDRLIWVEDENGSKYEYECEVGTDRAPLRLGKFTPPKLY